MLTKTGDLRPDSHADDDMSKKAEFFDDAGFGVVSKDCKKELEKPRAIKELKVDKEYPIKK